MTKRIAGLPFWELTFDADGDPDKAQSQAMLAEVTTRETTDLFVFSHGWNNDRAVAKRLYDGFFGLLAQQLGHAPGASAVNAGLAGVVWPSRRWSDEPIPDFTPRTPDDAHGNDGTAALPPTATAPPLGGPLDPTLDPQTLTDLRELFPSAAPALDRMAELLATTPDQAALEEFHKQLRNFSAGGVNSDDGEDDRADVVDRGSQPGMLLDEPTVLFSRYRDELQKAGDLPTDLIGGEAGLGDTLRGIWHGAKEALRQATYWQMKNRAGVVGSKGLGPLLAQLHEEAPRLRVHLIGHSFGARLVSFSLTGLQPNSPSPIKSVTLLQGAFSHFAFAKPLPFNASRDGALAGMLERIDGPLTVVFSEHDKAVGVFYPLASMAARDDSAAANRATWRWGGMGADGAQGVQAKLDPVRPAGPGNTYRFSPHAVLNVDASSVVCRGSAPSGAHSDIVHPELSWIVLSAGGLV
jgi:hypothetical protein